MRYFFDVTHDAQHVAESNRWEYSQQDDEATPLLKVAFLAPLLANAGRMIAGQGIKQMGKVGVKQGLKEGAKQMASKEGMKNLARNTAKNIKASDVKDMAMDAKRQSDEEARHKQMMQQQEQNRLMDAGKAKAGTGSSMAQ